MSDEMTLEELASKVSWEGGLYLALDYGIKVEDVPEEVKELWKEAVRLHNELDSVFGEIEIFLDQFDE